MPTKTKYQPVPGRDATYRRNGGGFDVRLPNGQTHHIDTETKNHYRPVDGKPVDQAGIEDLVTDVADQLGAKRIK